MEGSCVGPDNENAGKVDSCKGCPNQKECASGTSVIDPDIKLITDQMASVKQKILILSGKGGVGKSSISNNIARILSRNSTVGLLDLDITGPSLPRMMGLEGEQLHQSNQGWTPCFVNDNLAVISIGFMLPNPDDAIIWKGPKKNGLIKQFLKDVDWGCLDYLIIDTPPGTSDEHLSIVEYLKETGCDGAIIVTTPQEISLQDVRKQINFCKRVNINVLGVVENMSGFICPNCSFKSMIFPPTSGGAEKMAADMNVVFLGSIPIEPKLAESCDLGLDLNDSFPDSIAAQKLNTIVAQLFPQ